MKIASRQASSDGAMHTHCDVPQWWEAPVIVGGSGGSGTRGVMMLLEALGVRMACINSTLSSLTTSLCTLPCNPASDCALINSFRGPGTSWMRDNFSHVAACHVDPIDIEASSNAPNSDLCGGSKSAALRRLREAVRPEYRHPLRWGLKNPHSTYYVNVLRMFFPCLVYVNTVSAECPSSHVAARVEKLTLFLDPAAQVRDLPEMVRTGKHFSNRVQEAMRFGMLSAADGQALVHADSNRVQEAMRFGMLSAADGQALVHADATEPLLAMQSFYGGFIRSANLAVVAWTERCIPDRVVHVPLQRMVALQRSRSGSGCVHVVSQRLAAALRLDDVDAALNSTRAFAASSLPLVMRSMAESRLYPLAKGLESALVSPNGGWPEGPLQPAACSGEMRSGS